MFDTTTPGTWIEVNGWVVVRSAGGANAVRDRNETGNVLCPQCGRERAQGVIAGQELMF